MKLYYPVLSTTVANKVTVYHRKGDKLVETFGVDGMFYGIKK